MLSRAAYLSRLRRAFLVRVHPDRLHSFKDDNLRIQQAAAVQAIIQRLQEADVTEWQVGADTKPISRRMRDGLSKNTVECLVLPLNTNNATIRRASIRLDSDINMVLRDLANALRQSGAMEIPMPSDDLLVQRSPSVNQAYGEHTFGSSSPGAPPRLQKRQLKEFLSTVTNSTIEERKLTRIEAHAVAASVRQAFGFSAVDATRIGWSSSSVVILLRRLLSVKGEFASSLRPSFYPWKLVYSSSVNEEGAIDMYGAVLLLNPAGTNVQWLRGLQLVNETTNGKMQMVREEIDFFVKNIQSTWSVRLRKGLTCSSQAYYDTLKRVSGDTTANIPSSNVCASESLRNLPSVEDVDVVIEDFSICNRPQITESGSIMLGSLITSDEWKAAIVKRSHEAKRRRQLSKEDKMLSRQAARHAQQCLGLERVSFDERTLSHHDFRQSLKRLVEMSDEFDIVGHLLNIVPTDHFCHIADDGALVIPHNWC